MDNFFSSAYKGDPGVPHSGGKTFVNMWIGTMLYTAVIWVNPYFWHASTQFNWHGRAFLHEQYFWKKARAKNQPYEFMWNKQDKSIRDGYYLLWPDYFH